MNIVLDTDVIVAAFRSYTGASRLILNQALYQKEHIITVSVPLLLEYESVLKRPQHQSVHQLTDLEINEAIGFMASTANQQAIYFLWRPQLQDIADEMVLETAINGRAEAIVSFNQKHLRWLRNVLAYTA